jgi:hypothetical protein
MRLGFFIRLSIFLIVSLTIGIGSARWLIARSAKAIPIQLGSWQSWSDHEAGTDDPYERAHYLLSNRLPPAANQVRVYETERDDEGAAFDSNCVYTVVGPARIPTWWEISAIDPYSGARPADDARANAISSSQIVSNADGTFVLTIAREPMPGNWISPGDESRFSIAMKLRYSRRDTIELAAVLPRITRGECE